MIRHATIQDAGEITRIHVQTRRVAYDGIVPRAHLEGLSQEGRATRWQDWLSNATHGTLVAQIGEQVAG